MMPPTIRLFIADSHTLFRESLSKLLESNHGITTVGSAGSAEDAVRGVLDLLPHVVLLDIDMRGLSSFEAADRITRLSSGTKVIFLAASCTDSHIEQALRVKASGLLTKSQAPEDLIQAIRQVAQGGSYFSQEIQARMVNVAGDARLTPDSKTRTPLLTLREIEILRYLADGLSKKEIAATMHLSIKTVEGHAQKVMNKLDIHDRVGLTRYAIREGLIHP